MADTVSVTAINTDWTQVIGGGLQAIITPVIPDNSFLIRYEASKPSSDVIIGHKFYAKDDEPNAIVGSVNTEVCWIRSVSGNNLEVVVSAL